MCECQRFMEGVVLLPTDFKKKKKSLQFILIRLDVIACQELL